MAYLRNEKGLTLIELLLSFVILTFVFTSFFYFFIHAAKYTSINGEELKGINVAREKLVEIQQSTAIQNLLNDIKNGDTLTMLTTNYSTVLSLSEEIAIQEIDGEDYYLLVQTDGPYTVKCYIKETSDLPADYASLNRVLIEIYDRDSNLLSDTYGYLKDF